MFIMLLVKVVESSEGYGCEVVKFVYITYGMAKQTVSTCISQSIGKCHYTAVDVIRLLKWQHDTMTQKQHVCLNLS